MSNPDRIDLRKLPPVEPLERRPSRLSQTALKHADACPRGGMKTAGRAVRRDGTGWTREPESARRARSRRRNRAARVSRRENRG